VIIAMAASLPSLEQIARSSPEDDSALAQTLSTLFEETSILLTQLVPQLVNLLRSSSSPQIKSYSSLIDIALQTITTSWDTSFQSQFIAGHPRIGQVKNLSKLSANEQAALATPSEVIARLGYLNQCYEKRYQGLRYIIFVNGRTRTEIMDEMERFLGVGSMLRDGCRVDEPALEGIGSFAVGSREWKDELDRALKDVGLIAKSRLKAFGVQ
jgi:2-oxo-4-hydroxy-4-carboxy--5-ureidoimidazoline (OHCU) decarboxylase